MKQNDKEITWQDVYQLPLQADDILLYAWTKNHVMAITFLTYDEEIKKKIMVSINSGNPIKEEFPEDTELDIKLAHNDVRFDINEKPAFMVRGWGHLIGIGGLNLPSDVAAKIQDDFIAYIYKALTGKELKE